MLLAGSLRASGGGGPARDGAGRRQPAESERPREPPALLPGAGPLPRGGAAQRGGGTAAAAAAARGGRASGQRRPCGAREGGLGDGLLPGRAYWRSRPPVPHGPACSARAVRRAGGEGPSPEVGVMAAFAKAAKSRQRQHRERGQVASRRALGLLEKKRDYRLRADDFHQKRDALRALRRRAQERNPDEFYFRMARARLQQDGVHVIRRQEDEDGDAPAPEQQKLLKTQDLKYVEMKRVAEAKKIERLKSELHLLDAEGKQPNRHTFFFDTRREVQGFDIALHLNTAPELVSRVYNRPALETLKKKAVSGITADGQLQRLARQRKGQYSLLRQRIERERKMFVIAQKLQTRKDLLDKTQRVKVKKETVNQPAIYRFQFRRKR
ncbi:putative U3 small nucleolar RNA-associated protein 11 [Liasis olivaceus]